MIAPMTVPMPEGTSDKIDQALTEILGMHGPWVLAVETYDEQGEPHLATIWDPTSSKWTQLGIAHTLLLDLETPIRQLYEPDEDS